MKAVLISSLIAGQTMVPSGFKSMACSYKPLIICKLKMCFHPLAGIGILFLLSFPLKLKLIQAVPIPLVARCSDNLAWKFSSKRDFDMRSAYLLAINFLGNDSFSGSWIWKLPSLLRIQMFIWKCMQQSIGVKECLANRGIPLETTCPLCHLEAEYIMHALRGCSLVKSIWHQLGTHYLYSTFFS